MKKQLLKSLVIGSATLALIPAIGHAAGEQIVKIGFSSPLTGPQASVGKDDLNGAKMAIEELNNSKPSIGGNPVKFELLIEDDQADPKAGVQVAQKLIDAGAKVVVGPYNSGIAIPASKLYNDAGVIMLAAASNPRLTLQGMPYIFRVAAHDSQLGAVMAQYASKELKVKKVAIVDDRTAYGQGVAEEFMKAFKAAGGEIVGREYTNDKATDFNGILIKIKSQKPEAIFYGGYDSQAAGMTRQMTQLDIKAFLLGGAICDAEMIQVAQSQKDLVERVYCTQAGGNLTADSAGAKFSDTYQKRYGVKPLTYAVTFYDATKLIANVMTKAGSTDTKTLISALQSGNYKGVAATYEFDGNRDLKKSPASVYKFKNGELTSILSY